MTPYGYRIHDARALIDPVEQRRIIELYTAFVSGAPLKACVKAAQISRVPQTCKRMLANAIYLGTDFYPPLVSAELFCRAQEELRRRAESRKPRRAEPRIKHAPVATEFVLLPAQSPLASAATPQDYAVLQLDRVLPKRDQPQQSQTCAAHAVQHRPCKSHDIQSQGGTSWK